MSSHPSGVPPLQAEERERAFDALFRAHHPGLCRFVARIVGSHAVAEEIVQDVFLYLWTHQERVEVASIPRAYLYRAARNAAYNARRRQRLAVRERSAPSVVPARAITERLEQAELEALVHAAIERLPLRTRLVFTLSRQEEMTYREIAEVLGLSTKTIEVQMARALRALRSSLGTYLHP